METPAIDAQAHISTLSRATSILGYSHTYVDKQSLSASLLGDSQYLLFSDLTTFRLKT